MTETKPLMSVRLCVFTGYHIILKLGNLLRLRVPFFFIKDINGYRMNDRDNPSNISCPYWFIEAAVCGEIGV